MANYGFVYCMGHSCMPGIFKIGMTNRTPLTRRDELSSGTAVPGPFDLLFYLEIENACEIEKKMHEYFSASRVCDGREFFECCLGEIFFEFEQYSSDDSPMAVTNLANYLLSLIDMNAVRNKNIAEPAMAEA